MYGVYVGGRLAGDRLVDLMAERVAQDELIGVLRPMLEDYARERRPGECLGDWWQRRSGRRREH